MKKYFRKEKPSKDQIIGFKVTNLANCHPSIARGKVWCRTCGREKQVDPAESMRTGWAKCCGYTMTIDHPDTW